MRSRRNRRNILILALGVSLLVTPGVFVLLPSDTTAQSSTLTIDFEDGTLGALGGASDAPWQVVADTAAGGVKSMKSGAIGHSGGNGQFIESYIDLRVEIAADGGTVQFARKYNTESCCDFFRFSVDDMADSAARVQVSGSAAWASLAAPLPLAAGIHTLRWSYKKDYSAAPTNDGVWIDDIIITNVARTLPPPPPPPSMTIDFEDGTLGPLTSGGDLSWGVVSDTAASGSKSAKAGPIPDSIAPNRTRSYIELKVEIGSGNGSVQFSRKYKTESGYDYLYFLVDNMNYSAAVYSWSGSNNEWAIS
ncbi:hypothetical protein HY629_02955, partial [Candidatus Uhrbacteria bacterium]|nr:hypothetical protein [Candidatus Uhrbacteria bacterium]